MKKEDVHAIGTMSSMEKGAGTPSVPLWYLPLKVLFFVLGCITILLEAYVFGLWLIASQTQKVSHPSFLPIGLLLVGLFTALVELSLWFKSRALLFSTRGLLGISNETGSSSKGSSVMTQNNALVDIHSSTYASDDNVRESKEQLDAAKQPLKRATSPLQNNQFPSQIDTDGANLSSDMHTTVAGVRHPTRVGANIQTKDGRTRSFAVPREGNNLSLSADKSALNAAGTRYALADGVGTSFLPGRWAEIVTEQFVKRDKDFQGREDFEMWLSSCSNEWHDWVDTYYLPKARVKSGQADWTREVERGASTTFIGCSFSWDDLRQRGESKVHVTAVGDALFFLVSPSAERLNGWVHQSFRLQKAEEFGQGTETLGSPSKRIGRDWKRVYECDFVAKHTNVIVLTTDALAQWIMRYQEAGLEHDPWGELFSIDDRSEFVRFVNYYRSIGAMEVDDTTAIIIPLWGEDSRV